MFDLIAGLLTGGATGLLGTAMTTVTDYLERRARHREAIESQRLDVELAQIEARSVEHRATLALQTAELEAEGRALEASYADARERWSRAGEGGAIVAVDVVRGLTRPLITWLLIGLVAGIYWTSLPGEEALRTRIVATVLYLATTCIVWWFGGRRPSAPAAPGPR